MRNRKEMAAMYKVSQPTFRKLIKPLNLPKGKKILTPQEVDRIIQYLGPPLPK